MDIDGRERPRNVVIAVVCLCLLGMMAAIAPVIVFVGSQISAPTANDNRMFVFAMVWLVIAALLFVCAWRLFWGRTASGMLAVMVAVPASLLMLMALFPVMSLPFLPMATLALGAAVLLTVMVWTKPVRYFLGSF